MGGNCAFNPTLRTSWSEGAKRTKKGCFLRGLAERGFLLAVADGCILLHFRKSHFFICQPWHIIHTMVRLSVPICPSLRIEHLLHRDRHRHGSQAPGSRQGQAGEGQVLSPTLLQQSGDLIPHGGLWLGALVAHAAQVSMSPSDDEFSWGVTPESFKAFMSPSAFTGPSPVSNGSHRSNGSK